MAQVRMAPLVPLGTATPAWTRIFFRSSNCSDILLERAFSRSFRSFRRSSSSNFRFLLGEGESDLDQEEHVEAGVEQKLLGSILTDSEGVVEMSPADSDCGGADIDIGVEFMLLWSTNQMPCCDPPCCSEAAATEQVRG